jgi:hypothetical protein
MNKYSCLAEDTDRKELCHWKEPNNGHPYTMKLDFDTPNQDWVQYSKMRLNATPILNVSGKSK